MACGDEGGVVHRLDRRRTDQEVEKHARKHRQLQDTVCIRLSVPFKKW